MSNLQQPPELDLTDVEGDEIARIVIKGRPEIVACLDGLVFHQQEEAMIALLRAGLLNMASQALIDLDIEEEIAVSVADLQGRARRMTLASKALSWEIQNLGSSAAQIGPRSAAYKAEVCELLAEHLPPIAFSPQEGDVVFRWASASDEQEASVETPCSEIRRHELRTLLDDLDPQSNSGSSIFVTKLPRPRLAEWIHRWREESYRKVVAERPAAESPNHRRAESSVEIDLSLLRAIESRLVEGGEPDSDSSTRPVGPILPRGAL